MGRLWALNGRPWALNGHPWGLRGPHWSDLERPIRGLSDFYYKKALKINFYLSLRHPRGTHDPPLGD